MKLRTYLALLLAVGLALAGPARAEGPSLLGLFMDRVGQKATRQFGKKVVQGYALDVPGEIALQEGRGAVDVPGALAGLSTGDYLVDALAWVLGFTLAENALPFARPFVRELVANLAGEVLAYGAVKAKNREALDVSDLVGRSIGAGLGGTLGSLLLPGLGPVLGAWIGSTAGEILWEALARARRPAAKRAPPAPVSQAAVWAAAPAAPAALPLGDWDRAGFAESAPASGPALRGAPFLAR